MNFDEVILLVLATLAAVVAWPASWPIRIRLAFAGLAAGLLGAAAALLVSDLLNGWQESATLVVAAGALAVVGGGPVTLAVFSLVDRSESEPPTVTAAGSILRGGAWIGALERAATFATLTAGWPEGVAVVLALKGVARYPELRADSTPGRHAVAERFIIGTFTSLLWAVGCALVARAALHV